MTSTRLQLAPDPASGLDFLARLVVDGPRLRAWLHDCEPSLRQRLTHAVLLIASLQTASGLAMDSLLNVLGCRWRDEDEMGALNAVQLDGCVAFLQWVLELALSGPDDDGVRCTVIGGTSLLYADSRRDIAACRRAVETPIGAHDATTARDLIAIGEAAAGVSFARAVLSGRRAACVHDHHLWHPLQPTHVAPRTLDALLRYSNRHDERPLAVARAVVLLRHLGRCPACASVYRERAAALGMPAARIEEVAEQARRC